MAADMQINGISEQGGIATRLLQGSLERSIDQLQGVVACRVVFGQQGQVKGIHVIARPDRPAKHLVRDIESLLLIRFGMGVDYRRISLVQAESQAPPAVPRLGGVTYSVEGEAAKAEVIVRVAGGRYEGRATAPAAEASPEALAAEATLEAVKTLIGELVSGRLDSVTRVEVGGVEALLVAVGGIGPCPGDLLLGAAPVGDRPEEASAQATLNAVIPCLPTAQGRR